MIRIGAVNIDTSHPLGFGEEFEKDTRAKYVGVFNDSFRDDEEVNGFVKRFGLERHCTTMEELAQMCDIGMVHGCDWDKHLDYAMPFIEKGKPVFIDKPLVGNLADCDKILELAKNGATILGASSVRYCYEIKEFMEIPEEERGKIISITATSGVDEFNYGIHVVEGINALAGSSAKNVKFIGRAQVDASYCESYCIAFHNGITAVYHTMTGCWQPFVVTIITSKTTYQFKIDSSRLYHALVNEVCDYMENKPNNLVTVEKLVESVKIMLAGKASREQNGATIELSGIPRDLVGFNGTEFAKGYGNAAGAMYAQK